jgi:hypothetical protein
MQAVCYAVEKLTVCMAQWVLFDPAETVGKLRQALLAMADVAPTADEWRALADVLCPERND